MSSFPRGDQMNVLGPSLLVKDGTNKVGRQEYMDFDDELEDELSLDMSDTELLDLAEQWETDYKLYGGSMERRWNQNKQYYTGHQNQEMNAIKTPPVPSNILFDASETFYAQALAKNPDPVVWSDNTDAGNQEAKDTQTMLQYLADVLCLRDKLRMTTRLWNIYFLGILKHGWDADIHEISIESRNRKNFLLDPEGYVDSYGDFCGWLGEKITAPASTLARMFPKHERFIHSKVKGKMGTKVTWIEWWTDEYTFTTFKGMVLDKSLNPHFIYPDERPEAKGDQVMNVLKEGNNHFARPRKPYTFLSVFSFQEQPDDVTTLLEQNIPNQKLITDRIEQIARNFKFANNAIVFNTEGYDQQKASQAMDALQDGTGALCDGDPNKMIVRFPAPSFPPEAFDELRMNMDNLRSVYGVLGTSATMQDENTTARGMILNQQRDSTRVGGTIGDALNQVADNVFNWWVQLMHVYYDMNHTAAILGRLKAVEEATIHMTGFSRKLVVSVAPDSMKPKDQITEMNQAMELAQAGFLDPKSLLTILNVPNVDETAESSVLWKVDPQTYIQLNFPQLAQQLAMMQQQAQTPGQPSAPGNGITAPQPPPELSAPPASAGLNNVPLPAIPK